jgi:predicted PurR-regulated permease PerM
MKKFEIEKKHKGLLLGILIVICAAITYEKVLGNLKPLVDVFTVVKDLLVRVLYPFLFGFFIAFIFNPALRPIENLILKLKFYPPEKARKSAALITLALALGVVLFAIAFLVPEIILNLQPLVKLINDAFPKIWPTITEPARNILSELNAQDILNQAGTFFSTNLTNGIVGILRSIPDFLAYLGRGLLNIAMGLVIAYHVLSGKESMGNETKKIIDALFNETAAEKIYFVAKEANKVFERYIIGSLTDSIIVGTIFFIGGLFLKFPFLPILALIITITNVIPYFGPFLGLIPAVGLTLLNSLANGGGISKAVTVLIFILAMQQVDGLIIAPKIIGDSTGVKPVGVMFAIIVGGALAGFLGMFLGVPAFALCKNIFERLINKKLDERLRS